MITKEELKKEVDRLPENLLEEVYSFLRKVIFRNRKTEQQHGEDVRWKKWKNNLEEFTPDFMSDRNQPPDQLRESFD